MPKITVLNPMARLRNTGEANGPRLDTLDARPSIL